MDRDYAFRFTNDSYLTKEEVKRTLNLSSIDHIWEVILNYRKLYYKVLDVFSIEKKPFVLCYSQGLIDKVIRLERKINALYVKSILNKYSTYQNHKFVLNTLCDFNAITATSDNLIEALIEESITNYPRQYTLIHNYDLCLKDINKCYASPFNEITIKRLYSYLIHGDYSSIDNMSEIYRQNDLETYFETYSSYRHYEGCPFEKIPFVMENLFDYINTENGFGIIKCALIFYFIMYYKPFECFNEEMSVLLTKYYFKHEGLDLTYLPLEIILNELKKHDFKKVFDVCEETLDVTYFVNKFFDYLDILLNQEEKKIASYENETIKQEVLQLDDEVEKNVEEKIEQKELVLVPDTSNLEGVTFERKVSMPIIPKGLDEKDASLVASNLIEICPTLKKGQAEFYARHCTIGKYYTIQQYKEERKVAYETARTSMDNLCLLGFYKKEKIRNKFVYTPVIRD